MQIILDGITSTESLFEGSDNQGTIFRLSGTFVYEGDFSIFKDAKIIDGPEHLKGQPCEAFIDDTAAELRIFSKPPRGYLKQILAA